MPPKLLSDDKTEYLDSPDGLLQRQEISRYAGLREFPIIL